MSSTNSIWIPTYQRATASSTIKTQGWERGCQDCFQAIANYSWRSAIKDIFWNKYMLNLKHALEGKISLTIWNVNPISLLWKHTTCFSVLPFCQKHPILGGRFHSVFEDNILLICSDILCFSCLSLIHSILFSNLLCSNVLKTQLFQFEFIMSFLICFCLPQWKTEMCCLIMFALSF